MMTIFKSVMLLASLLLCQLLSQEVIVVHPNVGATIDLEEKIHYHLFPDIYNFKDAQFYLTAPDTIVAKIRLWSGSEVEERYIYYTQYQVYLLASGIASQPLLDDKERVSIHKRFQPLYTDKFLADIKENTYCRLKLKDKRKFDAVYYRTKNDSVMFWLDKQLIPIKKENIMRLKYWDNYEQKNWIKWGCLGAMALVSYGTVGFTAGILNFTGPNIILLQYLAASVGSIIGYKISPTINDYLLTATVIEFRTSRIKRLDIIERTFYNGRKLKDKIWQLIAP